MYQHLSDIELATAFRQQPDSQIIGELYTRYRLDIYRYGIYCNYKYCQNNLSHDVLEDFTIDVFARLFQQLKQYEISSSFKNWLTRSAHNLFMDMLKKETRYVSSDGNKEVQKKMAAEVEIENFDRLLDVSPQKVGLDASVEEIIAILNEQQIDIAVFLARCIEYISNEEQKTCLYHFYIEQLTYKQISQLTGYDLKKVKSALQHGKRSLQHTVIKAIRTI